MPEYGKPIDNNLHWKSTLDFFKDASLEKVSQFSPKEKQELEDDDTAMGADYPQDPDTANAPKSAAPIVDGGFKEEARRANPIEESLLKFMKADEKPRFRGTPRQLEPFSSEEPMTYRPMPDAHGNLPLTPEELAGDVGSTPTATERYEGTTGQRPTAMPPEMVDAARKTSADRLAQEASPEALRDRRIRDRGRGMSSAAQRSMARNLRAQAAMEADPSLYQTQSIYGRKLPGTAKSIEESLLKLMKAPQDLTPPDDPKDKAKGKPSYQPMPEVPDSSYGHDIGHVQDRRIAREEGVPVGPESTNPRIQEQAAAMHGEWFGGHENKKEGIPPKTPFTVTDKPFDPKQHIKDMQDFHGMMEAVDSGKVKLSDKEMEGFSRMAHQWMEDQKAAASGTRYDSGLDYKPENRALRNSSPIEKSLLKLMKYQYSPEEIPSRKYEYPSRDDRPDLHAHQSGGLNMPEYNPDIPANPSPDEQQRIRNVSQLAEGVGKRYGEGKGQGVLDASKITPEMVEDQRVSDAFKRDVSRYSEKNPNNPFKNSVENSLFKLMKGGDAQKLNAMDNPPKENKDSQALVADGDSKRPKSEVGTNDKMFKKEEEPKEHGQDDDIQSPPIGSLGVDIEESLLKLMKDSDLSPSKVGMTRKNAMRNIENATTSSFPKPQAPRGVGANTAANSNLPSATEMESRRPDSDPSSQTANWSAQMFAGDLAGRINRRFGTGKQDEVDAMKRQREAQDRFDTQYPQAAQAAQSNSYQNPSTQSSEQKYPETYNAFINNDPSFDRFKSPTPDGDSNPNAPQTPTGTPKISGYDNAYYMPSDQFKANKPSTGFGQSGDDSQENFQRQTGTMGNTGKPVYYSIKDTKK